MTIGFALPVVFVGVGTLRQAFSPPELIGRVCARITFVMMSVVPVGALLDGALSRIGPRGALLVAGMSVLLTPVWLLFTGALVTQSCLRPCLTSATSFSLVAHWCTVTAMTFNTITGRG